MKNFRTTFRGSVNIACELYRQLEALDETLDVENAPLHVEVVGKPGRLEIYLPSKAQITHHAEDGDMAITPPYVILFHGVSYEFRTDAPPPFVMPRAMEPR